MSSAIVRDLHSKVLCLVLFLVFCLGAVFISSLGVFASTSIDIPLARPQFGNSGYMFLASQDGTKWFALTYTVMANQTNLANLSSVDPSGFDSYPLFLQLELDGTTREIERLTMAYVDQRQNTAYHSGDIISSWTQDYIILYQYAMYDGSYVKQGYGYDPSFISDIVFPAGWVYYPNADSSTSRQITGEYGGGLYCNVVRVNHATNKYQANAYTLKLWYSNDLSWAWINQKSFATVSGSVDSYLQQTPGQISQTDSMLAPVESVAPVVQDLAQQVEQQSQQMIDVAGSNPPPDMDTILGQDYDLALNPALQIVPALLGHYWAYTLIMCSLGVSLIFVLLRGVHK